MRLLHTKKLKLHEFFGAKIPPYAILSHTWGKGEVSFQELQSGHGKFKAGYDKIRRCCQMAALDGFQWAWVDTCCIDKTSSSELSEAINSMYTWYRASEVCYVHLADVPANLGTRDTELAIRKCRWFTRGWTLQELIAPPSVIFFDSEWGELGTKGSLERLIFETTKVKVEVLRDADQMEEFSIAQKMSWASTRVTTRVEDIAYCLLGIFGVNMPMLYGEGDHAFVRLQEEIMKNTADHSIFAWTSKSYFNHGLLARSPAQFERCGNIVQDQNPAANSFSSTNKGIHLHLRTKIFGKSQLCLAMLECHEIGNETKSLGIYIERQKAYDAFKRIWSDELGRVDVKDLPNFKYEDIFVKQERVSTTIPAYENYGISLGSWERWGQLDIAGNDVWKQLPSSASVSKEFSGFQFSEVNSPHGFVLILKHTRYAGHPKTSLKAKIFEHIPDLAGISYFGTTYHEWYNASIGENLSFTCSRLKGNLQLEKIWMSQPAERLYWQHPVKKWWISVIVKRGMHSHERLKIVHINCKSPRVD